jgi:hypothetical protein
MPLSRLVEVQSSSDRRVQEAKAGSRVSELDDGRRWGKSCQRVCGMIG